MTFLWPLIAVYLPIARKSKAKTEIIINLLCCSFILCRLYVLMPEKFADFLSTIRWLNQNSSLVRCRKFALTLVIRSH